MRKYQVVPLSIDSHISHTFTASTLTQLMTTNQKIQQLRSIMKREHIAAVIIPSNDPHQSEYVADCWKGREWISGFTGSAGTVVVATDHAGLWTDSRYYLQGVQELAGSEMILHKAGSASDPTYIDWLVESMPQGSRVALDGHLCSVNQYRRLEKKFASAGITLVTHIDAVSEVWADQPARPTEAIFELDSTYAGEERSSKLSRIRSQMSAKQASHHLVSTLDDVAWILNIRGADVDFNPVAVAYLLISTSDATLYVDNGKVPEVVAAALQSDGVHVKSYDSLLSDLNELADHHSVLVDGSDCSIVNYKAINAQKVIGPTISRAMKAIKNDVEIAHSKNAMVKDGVAIAHAFYWLHQLHKDGGTCTEAEFADKLAHYRAQQDGYMGESFPAIIGYEGNGAIIHYRPEHGSSAVIEPHGVLLADSGGQYLEGTTDITRTIALGTPTAEEKRNFTLVLKGHIELAKAQFPIGTTGGQLDILARMHLWGSGLNYGHGTGHGVGFFLNVHEGPHGIATPLSPRAKVKMEAGTLTSNEPGFYKEGAYGIRVENLMYTVEADVPGFYKFDTITLYPVDLQLIDENIMTKSEKAWLNKYHHEVYTKVGPHLKGDIKTWFELKCRGMN